MDERLEAVTRRVESVAIEVRRYRWTSALLALLLVAALAGPGRVAARGAPRELIAQRFVLVSATGAALAALEAGPQGHPRLTLLGGGSVRAELGLDGVGEPALRLLGPKGELRIELGLASDEARVRVRGGIDATSVSLNAGGVAPRLEVTDADGKERLWAAVRLGSPVVQFLDKRGFARTGLTTFNDDTGLSVVSQADGKTPGLVLLGKERTVLWSAP